MSLNPSLRRKAALWGAVLACTLPACRPSRILLTPVPSRVESAEGYAQLRITGDGGSSRSKFAFAFSPPDSGKIEVSDFFVGSLYQILIQPDKAFFILPSKKVFWQGPEEDIIDKFLGFPLELEEMIFLMTGQDETRKIARNDWTFDHDSRGRVIGGRRGELKYTVRKFAGDTSVVTEMEFEHPLSSGRLTILSIGFNRPLRAGLFSSAFLRSFEQKTWEEIQEMLSRED